MKYLEKLRSSILPFTDKMVNFAFESKNHFRNGAGALRFGGISLVTPYSYIVGWYEGKTFVVEIGRRQIVRNRDTYVESYQETIQTTIAIDKETKEILSLETKTHSKLNESRLYELAFWMEQENRVYLIEKKEAWAKTVHRIELSMNSLINENYEILDRETYHSSVDCRNRIVFKEKILMKITANEGGMQVVFFEKEKMITSYNPYVAVSFHLDDQLLFQCKYFLEDRDFKIDDYYDEQVLIKQYENIDHFLKQFFKKQKIKATTRPE